MGNFSRDTYKAAKGYAAVRLQQGVPLVDADWNEQADIARNELYAGLALTAGSVAARGGLNVTGIGSNDLRLNAGSAVISGRPLSLATLLRYTTQRYRDPALAAKDGIVRPPDLTTPASARTDIVYLHVFEREVDSAEDQEVINPAIGIETAVRTKRESVLRVQENSSSLPVALPGHQTLALALLRRPAGVAAISSAMIEDIKPYASWHSRTRRLAVPPMLLPISNAAPGPAYPSWAITGNYSNVTKLRAAKPTAASDAWGVAPLSLPDGAYLRRLRMRGICAAHLRFSLDRNPHDSSATEQLVDTYMPAPAGAPFDRELTIDPDGRHVVDNAQFSYFVQAWADDGPNLKAEIHGIIITYDL